MRFGITILPEDRWAQAGPRWQRAEEFGFHHAWTYDHLTWSSLPDSGWFAATPVLTAAAMVTSRIGLGYFVASPNFRHPASFLREVLALDDISGGRIILGLSKGGDIDARILGGPELSLGQRSARFAEFVDLLDRLCRTDDVSAEGEWFGACRVRNRPGFVQQPRPPFVMAANGPKAMALAVQYGQGWVTTGPAADTDDAWWEGVAGLAARFEEACVAAGADLFDYARYLHLDAGPRFSMSSTGVFEDMTGRAAGLGFTDVITHWPRAEGVYAGRVETLEAVATDVLPRWWGD